ncbi:MAG: hypothetical protein NT056_04485 [Proteobacteria bacterium]|nr:hypothetical protein [Pseudomonadota bacterium]
MSELVAFQVRETCCELVIIAVVGFTSRIETDREAEATVGAKAQNKTPTKIPAEFFFLFKVDIPTIS